jgi:hypothetical protein
MKRSSNHPNHLSRIAVLLVTAILLYCGVASASAPPSGDKAAAANSGKIIETMNSGGYTYILVDSGTAKTWVALPEMTVKIGDAVHYAEGMLMQDFHSKTLNRTFASLVFSPGLTDKGPQTTEKQPTTASSQEKSSFDAAVQAETSPEPTMSSSGGSSGAIVPFAELKIEKAKGENGHSVQEIFTQAKELDGKTVRLQGKVMKVNLNIMGRNWMHLQDGTGDPMTNTHDMVVTTSETPEQGQVVTVEGKVSAGKDFGAGYSYAAMIEDAKILH